MHAHGVTDRAGVQHITDTAQDRSMARVEIVMSATDFFLSEAGADAPSAHGSQARATGTNARVVLRRPRG
jgi:hypothetical protein